MTINSIDPIMPPFLQKGDQVAIIASAKFVLKSDLDHGIQLLKERGFKVKVNNSVFQKKHVFAGSIDERVANINSAFQDKETKAIFFARGGYGSIQIIDHIDFRLLAKNPKWLIGFSDLTVILMHLYFNYNICSIHGPMIYNFIKTKQTSVDATINLIKGKVEPVEIKKSKFNIKGVASGKIIGGNLSIIYSLMGSSSFLLLDEDYILFIEDVDEYLYHIERIFYSLARAGVLQKLKGLIVGQMTNMLDNEILFGKTVYELIYDIVNQYNYPLCFGLQVGHEKQNHPILLGRKITLEVNDQSSKINYEE